MDFRTKVVRQLCRMPLVSLPLSGEEKDLIAAKKANFLRCDRNISTSRGKLDSTPLIVQLEVTNHCNIKCVMCPRLSDIRYLEHQEGFEGTITFETFKKLEPLFPRAIKCLLFGNGEPLMNPDLLPMLEMLKRYGVDVSFSTNGLIMTEKFSRFFVERGIDNITFSVDGATAETYNAIRVGSDFGRVIANIKRLHGLKMADPDCMMKPFITIACVLMSVNVHEVGAMVEMCHDIGAGILHFEPLLWYETALYDRKVHSKYRLSLIALEEIVRHFEDAAAGAARRGVKIVGPYVDESGRFKPETLRMFDPTLAEEVK